MLRTVTTRCHFFLQVKIFHLHKQIETHAHFIKCLTSVKGYLVKLTFFGIYMETCSPEKYIKVKRENAKKMKRTIPNGTVVETGLKTAAMSLPPTSAE